MKKSVLITGVNGFIGSHFAEFLLKKNFIVWGCDVLNKKDLTRLDKKIQKNKNFIYKKVDVSDKKRFLNFLNKIKVSTIFHFAAIVGVQNYIDDPIKVIKFNISSTFTLSDFCKNKDIHLVFSSTSEAFGKNPNIPWDENADRTIGPSHIPRWSYSSSKNTCEHILFGYYKKYNLPLTIVRFFNVYGPKQNPIYLVSKTISNLQKNIKPLIYDRGKQTRCMTYIKDIINALYKVLLKRKKLYGKSYNLGNEKEIKIKNVIEKICEMFGKKNFYKNIQTKNLYNKYYEDIPRRIPDCKSARADLNWNIKFSFEEGIRETLNYYKLLK